MLTKRCLRHFGGFYVSDDSTTQCVLFPGIFPKPVVAQFDQREGSSDGGALLLKAADQHYRLVEELTACLQDERQAGKVDHTLRALVAQRVFSIACGYPDANDAALLASDPIHKLLLDRDPVEGRDLASQPTGVAFRECDRSQGTVSHGGDLGPKRYTAARQTIAAPGVPGHHRSGSHR